MTFVEQVRRAFFTLVEREDGNLRQISIQTGVNYATIHRLKNKKSAFEKMSIQTLEKLFPTMRARLLLSDGTAPVSLTAANHSAIANGSNARATVNGAALSLSPDAISRAELEDRILHADEFSGDERIKFLLFLRDKMEK